MAALASPSRRVLENKSTNASILTHRIHHGSNQKPSRLTAVAPARVPNENTGTLITKSPKIGQKRSIEHVDGSDEHIVLGSGKPPGDSRQNESLSTRWSDDTIRQSQSQPDSKSSTQTVSSSAPTSQEGSFQVEEQFHIPYEASQKTLEELVSERFLVEIMSMDRRLSIL
jgi:hypothetical protein